MKFLNFDLSLEAKTAEGYPVQADSAKYGQGRGLCKLDLAAADLVTSLGTIAKDEADGTVLTTLGKLLGVNLFNGTVEDLFSKIVGATESQDKTGVRLRLRINAPELNVLPWELLQAEHDKEPLGTSIHTVVTRYIELNELVREVEAPMPLRMLGIIPQGSGLDTDKEKAALNQAVAELGDSLQLTWLEGKVTRDLIRDTLGKTDYHIIHFIGHGNMDGTKASLRLTDEYGDDAPVPAETFAGFFRDSSVRLVVLNACRGAARSAADALLGVAPQVVQRGVPAVVAMQWDINDRVAQSFAKTFYRTLCIGPAAGQVDLAVTKGRAALYDDWPGNRAFATPVLFLRADDGRLWKEAGSSTGDGSVPVTVKETVVQVSGGTIAGDLTLGNKTTTSSNNVPLGSGTASIPDATAAQPADGLAVTALLTQAGLWQTAMTTKIEGLSLSADEKNDLKDQVSKIKTELVKNVNLDSARVTKLINTLGLMGGTDLIELTRKRLGPPLQGIGFSLSMNTDFKVTVEKAD